MSSSEFVSEGWSRAAGGEPSGVDRLTVDQVRLVPAPEVRQLVSGISHPEQNTVLAHVHCTQDCC